MSTELLMHKNFNGIAGIIYLQSIIFRQYSNSKDALKEKSPEKKDMKTSNQQITLIFNWV